jgi:hypothetical protein
MLLEPTVASVAHRVEVEERYQADALIAMLLRYFRLIEDCEPSTAALPLDFKGLEIASPVRPCCLDYPDSDLSDIEAPARKFLTG